MRNIFRAVRCALLLLSCVATSPAFQKPNAPADAKDWIQRSHEYAQALIKVRAKYEPEFAGRFGVEGLDEQVSQFPSDRRTRQRGDSESALAQLQKAMATEKDPQVRQDLEIMIRAAQQALRGRELTEKYDMPYFNVSELVFAGLQAILDDQVSDTRRNAAVVRLRKYTGMEPGFTPITEQAKARTFDWSKPGQLGP